VVGIVLENNALSDIGEAVAAGKTPEQEAEEHVQAENERYKQENCAGMSSEACSVQMYKQRIEDLKNTASLGVDFVPVVGDIKSFAEAQSALDYLVAAIGIIPGAGDIAGKTIKAAETALKKGDLAEASKLINQAGNEVKALDVGSYKELKDRAVVGDALEHDHIPSFAALKKAKENELGRPLTEAESKSLYQNATAVEVPKRPPN
jgi:filamentous hemagglutinin